MQIINKQSIIRDRREYYPSHTEDYSPGDSFLVALRNWSGRTMVFSTMLFIPHQSKEHIPNMTGLYPFKVSEEID